MQPVEEEIARLEKRILSRDTQIGVLEKQAAVLEVKESRFRNRRRNKEQKANVLRAKRDADADRIILLLVKADPAQHQRLLDRLPDHLKSLPASSLLDRQPAGVGEAPTVGPEVAAAPRKQDASPTPSPPTNDNLQPLADTVPSRRCTRSPRQCEGRFARRR